MTRSSIKPRLLFPAAGKGKKTERPIHEDEEAVTDIEDHVFGNSDVGADVDVPATPLDMATDKHATPKAPRFAPASPPATTRTTRVKPAADPSPVKKAAKPHSPFDGWRRSKRATEPRGHKREADPLPGSDEASKRQRA